MMGYPQPTPSVHFTWDDFQNPISEVSRSSAMQVAKLGDKLVESLPSDVSWTLVAASNPGKTGFSKESCNALTQNQAMAFSFSREGVTLREDQVLSLWPGAWPDTSWDNDCLVLILTKGLIELSVSAHEAKAEDAARDQAVWKQGYNAGFTAGLLAATTARDEVLPDLDPEPESEPVDPVSHDLDMDDLVDELLKIEEPTSPKVSPALSARRGKGKAK